jgi:hypothetical protein
MGMLWRLFAPKPLKKARRTVRKASHPVRTATPKPVKQLQRAAHPASLAKLKAEDAAVNALRGKQRPRTAQAPATPKRNKPGQGKANQTRRDERPAWMVDGMEVTLLDGHEDLEVVGESHYQENLWRLVGPHRRGDDDWVRSPIYALLVPEDDNPYDGNAIAVWVEGLKAGYLSRGSAREYRPGLLAMQARHGQPIALNGVIAGGGIREDGPGRLGVFLRHDPANFGL